MQGYCLDFSFVHQQFFISFSFIKDTIFFFFLLPFTVFVADGRLHSISCTIFILPFLYSALRGKKKDLSLDTTAGHNESDDFFSVDIFCCMQAESRGDSKGGNGKGFNCL